MKKIKEIVLIALVCCSGQMLNAEVKAEQLPGLVAEMLSCAAGVIATGVVGEENAKLQQELAQAKDRKLDEYSALFHLCFFGKAAGTLDEAITKRVLSQSLDSWRWDGKERGACIKEEQVVSDENMGALHYCLLQSKDADEASGKSLTPEETIEFGKAVAAQADKVQETLAKNLGATERSELLQRSLAQKKDLRRAFLVCQAAKHRTDKPLTDAEKEVCLKIAKKVYKSNLKTVVSTFGECYTFTEPDFKKIVTDEFERREKIVLS